MASATARGVGGGQDGGDGGACTCGGSTAGGAGGAAHDAVLLLLDGRHSYAALPVADVSVSKPGPLTWADRMERLVDAFVSPAGARRHHEATETPCRWEVTRSRLQKLPDPANKSECDEKLRKTYHIYVLEHFNLP